MGERQDAEIVVYIPVADLIEWCVSWSIQFAYVFIGREEEEHPGPERSIVDPAAKVDNNTKATSVVGTANAPADGETTPGHITIDCISEEHFRHRWVTLTLILRPRR